MLGVVFTSLAITFSTPSLARKNGTCHVQE